MATRKVGGSRQLRTSVRLVVFDLDGTLIDSLQDLADSTNVLLAECGAEPRAREDIGRMVGDGAATLVARAFAAAGQTPPADALLRFRAIYNQRLLKFTRPYPGIDDVLTRLDGVVKLAVLTNKPIDATRQILQGLELARHFSQNSVLGGDGPLPRKPDPAGLEWLATAAGVTLQDTWLVGDSVIDWRTARAASARVCMAGYGFGFGSVPTHELQAGDHIIQRPTELLEIL